MTHTNPPDSTAEPTGESTRSIAAEEGLLELRATLGPNELTAVPIASDARRRRFKWEAWATFLVGLGAGFVALWLRKPESDEVPDFTELLPWWAPAGVVAAFLLVGFLNVVVRLTDDPVQRTKFRYVAGAVKPLVQLFAVGAGLGVLYGWAAISTNPWRVAVLFTIPIVAIGLAVILVCVPVGQLKAWFHRMN